MTEVSTRKGAPASAESLTPGDDLDPVLCIVPADTPRPDLFTRGEVTAPEHAVVAGDPDRFGFWEVDFGQHITVSMYVEVRGDVAHVHHPRIEVPRLDLRVYDAVILRQDLQRAHSAAWRVAGEMQGRRIVA